MAVTRFCKAFPLPSQFYNLGFHWPLLQANSTDGDLDFDMASSLTTIYQFGCISLNAFGDPAESTGREGGMGEEGGTLPSTLPPPVFLSSLYEFENPAHTLNSAKL